MGLEAAQRGKTIATHASRRSSQSKKSESSPGKVATNTPEHTYPYEWQDLINQSQGATVLSAYQAMADHSPRVQQLMALQALADQAQRTPTRSASETLQLVPATAKGSTHLVERKNKSIMRGKSVFFIESGTSLDVQPDQRVISRRGPNQELVGEYDLRGDHIYCWYKVNQVKDKDFHDDVFIREGTFAFVEHPLPEFAHDLGQSTDKRSRQSHVAIKLEVWYNSDRRIDPSGHMVMEDYSAPRRGTYPIYEYTWGKDKEVNLNKLQKREDIYRPEFYKSNFNDEYKSSEMTNVKITLDSTNESNAPPPSKHKTLVARNVPREENEETQKNQLRYFNPVTNKFQISMPKTVVVDPVKRFNKKKAVELLVTKSEYEKIMTLYDLRKDKGFYCFYREARTSHGYDMATRCLSFLEDVAIEREKYELIPGHAEDVLNSFAELNAITAKHTFEKDVTL